MRRRVSLRNNLLHLQLTLFLAVFFVPIQVIFFLSLASSSRTLQFASWISLGGLLL